MPAQSIDRLIVSRGPAMITHRAGVFFTREDLVIDFSKETKEIPSSAFGPLDEVNLGVKASAKFRPVGEFEHLGVLWPYGITPVGRSIFGDADYPLLIQPLDEDQQQTTFKAAGISKMPDLFFTAADTLIQDMEFQMVGENNVAVDDAERLFTQEANTIDLGALPYDPDALIIQAYNNSWLSAGTYQPAYSAEATDSPIDFDDSAAAVQIALRTIAALSAVTVAGNYLDGFTVTNGSAITAGNFTSVYSGLPGGTTLRADQVSANVVLLRLFPWAKFQAREGIKVAFSLQLTEDTADAIGHYDTIFSGLSVTATGLPQGVTDVAALAAAAVQGPGSVRGTKLSSGGHNLDIYGDGVFFRLYQANIRKSSAIYGRDKQRVGDLEWVAARSIGGGGALNPLFYIGAAAPV